MITTDTYSCPDCQNKDLRRKNNKDQTTCLCPICRWRGKVWQARTRTVVNK